VDADAERALRYRNLAEDIRTRANAATSDQTRQMFLTVAQNYDSMAKAIEDADKRRFG